MRKSALIVRGFTLIELLVVIGIIGILAALIVLALNPAEIQRKSRDATRISDAASLRRAMDIAVTDGAPINGSQATPYVSDSAGTRTASDVTNYVGMDVSKYVSILPADPSYVAGGAANVTVSDGTVGGTATTTQDLMRYEFTADGTYYEINSRLESVDNYSKLASDGGTDVTWYEIGTDPGLDLI